MIEIKTTEIKKDTFNNEFFYKYYESKNESGKIYFIREKTMIRKNRNQQPYNEVTSKSYAWDIDAKRWDSLKENFHPKAKQQKIKL